MSALAAPRAGLWKLLITSHRPKKINFSVRPLACPRCAEPRFILPATADPLVQPSSLALPTVGSSRRLKNHRNNRGSGISDGISSCQQPKPWQFLSRNLHPDNCICTVVRKNPFVFVFESLSDRGHRGYALIKRKDKHFAGGLRTCAVHTGCLKNPSHLRDAKQNRPLIKQGFSLPHKSIKS